LCLKLEKLRTVYIERRERFNAAHKLYNDKWSLEKNIEVFGKCANVNWHGHNFEIVVTLKGKPHPDTGFVMDLKDLSMIIKDAVIEPLDHKNLNLDVPFLEGILPSTENLVIAVWEQLEEKIKAEGCELCRIRIVETENNFVDYYGGREPF
jgi:6-pyruvoyltetrahydropterin/6-carboxytetrahydropterin synthase